MCWLSWGSVEESSAVCIRLGGLSFSGLLKDEKTTNNLHFKQIVRNTCMTASVLSSHSPPFPFVIPNPTSSSSSIKSALVQVTMIGIPAIL